MPQKRLIGLLAILGILLVIGFVRGYPQFRRFSQWNEAARLLRSLPQEKLKAASEAYAKEWIVSNTLASVPVPLSELVRTGFLPSDPRPLGTEEIIIFVQDDPSKSPRNLMSLRTADGSTVILLTDGTVHCFPGP